MFVVSVCALCSGAVLKLNWWPMVRDCAFYSLSIFVMLIVICNDLISWPEALFMMLLYVVYCICLHFNTALERWAHTWKLPIKLPTKEEQSALVTYKNVPEQSYTQGVGGEEKQTKEITSPSQQQDGYNAQQQDNSYMDPNASWDPNAAWGSGAAAAAAPPVQNYGGGGDNWGNDSWGEGANGQQNYGYNTGL